LFTDVLGSTQLWSSDAKAMGVALARHDNIVRGAIAGMAAVCLYRWGRVRGGVRPGEVRGWGGGRGAGGPRCAGARRVPTHRPKPPREPQPLSEREREVLQLVARGHYYRLIGAELFIAEKTVENHVRIE
jgi:hypothetical protein